MLSFITDLEESFQENLIEDETGRTLGSKYRSGSRSTSANHKRKRYVGAGAQAGDFCRTFQDCRVTFNLRARDLAGDIHSVHGELTTAIPCRYCWHKRQTLKASRNHLAFLFSME